MIEKNKSAEYYAGARDAVWQYAVWRDGNAYVGSGTKTWQQAMEEIYTMDDASPDGLNARFEAPQPRCTPNGFGCCMTHPCSYHRGVVEELQQKLLALTKQVDALSARHQGQTHIQKVLGE